MLHDWEPRENPVLYAPVLVRAGGFHSPVLVVQGGRTRMSRVRSKPTFQLLDELVLLGDFFPFLGNPFP